MIEHVPLTKILAGDVPPPPVKLPIPTIPVSPGPITPAEVIPKDALIPDKLAMGLTPLKLVNVIADEPPATDP